MSLSCSHRSNVIKIKTYNKLKRELSKRALYVIFLYDSILKKRSRERKYRRGASRGRAPGTADSTCSARAQTAYSMKYCTKE